MTEPDWRQGDTGGSEGEAWYSQVPRVFKGDRTVPRAALYFFLFLALSVGARGLYSSGWTSDPLLHGTLEALATLLAFVVGSLALVRFYSKKQITFLFIGTGFLGTGLLDSFSSVVTTGSAGDWTAGQLEGIATWSFTASGAFLSLFLLLSWGIWKRRSVNPDWKGIREQTVYLVALLLAVVVFAAFNLFHLTGALRPEQFIRQPAEFIPAALFLLAFFGYLAKDRWRHDAFEHWLIICLLLGVMAHGAYMPFSSQYHGALFVGSHVLKVLGYGCVLVGLLANVFVTFRSEEEAARSTREANSALAKEIDFRRQAERVIQESEERLQDFLDNAHDLIQSVDRDGKFLYVNRAWKEVLGYSDEEVEELTFFDILDPGCRRRCEREFAEVLKGDTSSTLEVDLVASDGRVVRCSGSANAWVENGEPVATRSILRDMTEQHEARRDLEAFQANLRALVENTGDAIWSVDRSNRLITFNTAFSMALEVRTGREPQVGDGPAACLPRSDAPWYAEMYERALHGEAFSELRDEEIGGQIRSFELFFNPIREASGISGVAVFGKDVTARRKTQLALRMAKEEAERANQAKSQFLASMSHELRTPLNSVIGFTNILRKNRGGKLEQQELGFLERIIANGKHLLDLINEVLDLAKIEAGRMELDLETVDFGSFIDGVLAQLEGQVREKDVVLRGDVPEDLNAVTTDTGKLKQVIINLVGNSVKFTEEGEIVVRVLTAEDGRTPNAIAVSDTGIGIPPERLKAIFEAFQQADGTTSRKYGGTGLGLTISRSLCQLMGYDLRVESQEGEGSTFTILLYGEASPEKQAHAELMEEALRPMESVRPRSHGEAFPEGSKGHPAERHEGAPQRVLVIDDDKDTRDLLQDQLEELGCEVQTAASAAEGIEKAKETRPGLITLDLLMPGMSGWEALKEFKEEPELQDIPVVIISVVAGEEGTGSLLGAVDLLTKPVDRRDLLRVLRRNIGEPRGRRILVVEDDPDTRALFQGYLEYAGCEVTVAGNGEEAEAALSASFPDLILLDLIMPVMDGTAFLQRLRRNPNHVEIPVIICTGKELSLEERRRLLSQVTEIVEKGDGFKTDLMTVLTRFFSSSDKASK